MIADIDAADDSFIEQAARRGIFAYVKPASSDYARCTFPVSGLLDRLVYLSAGLSVVLAFIGLKLILHYGHLQAGSVQQISTGASLAVIAAVLGLTTAASALKARRDPAARAHAGSLRERDEDATPRSDLP